RYEDAEANQVAELLHAPPRARRPKRDVEIAKPARAVLHVGLEQVDRRPEPLVAIADFAFEPAHETMKLAIAEDAAQGPLIEGFHRAYVAGDGAPIEERGGRREVASGRGERVGDVDDLVSDADAGVPKGVEQCLGDGADALGRLGGEQPNVQVALQAHHAA